MIPVGPTYCLADLIEFFWLGVIFTVTGGIRIRGYLPLFMGFLPFCGGPMTLRLRLSLIFWESFLFSVASSTSKRSRYSTTSVRDFCTCSKLICTMLLRYCAGAMFTRISIRSPSDRGLFSDPDKYDWRKHNVIHLCFGKYWVIHINIYIKI